MSHDCAIGMVQEMLDRGINITQVSPLSSLSLLNTRNHARRQLYVDTVGVESIYQDKLQKLFPSMKVLSLLPQLTLELLQPSYFCNSPSSSLPFVTLQVVVCKKCDDLYTICSAGSICAKVMWPGCDHGHVRLPLPYLISSVDDILEGYV